MTLKVGDDAQSIIEKAFASADRNDERVRIDGEFNGHYSDFRKFTTESTPRYGDDEP